LTGEDKGEGENPLTLALSREERGQKGSSLPRRGERTKMEVALSRKGREDIIPADSPFCNPSLSCERRED